MGRLHELGAEVTLGFSGALEINMEHWYALYTKPHKEHHVSSILESKGFETYLPTIQVRKNRKTRTEPFFSCYLFVRTDPAAGFPAVRWTPGLRRIVSFGGAPAVVRDDVVALIRKRLAEMAESGYPKYDRFKPGEPVRIKAGPLTDLEAIFDRSLSASERVRVLVDILGRLTPCVIESGCLEKAGRRLSL